MCKGQQALSNGASVLWTLAHGSPAGFAKKLSEEPPTEFPHISQVLASVVASRLTIAALGSVNGTLGRPFLRAGQTVAQSHINCTLTLPAPYPGAVRRHPGATQAQPARLCRLLMTSTSSFERSRGRGGETLTLTIQMIHRGSLAFMASSRQLSQESPSLGPVILLPFSTNHPRPTNGIPSGKGEPLPPAQTDRVSHPGRFLRGQSRTLLASDVAFQPLMCGTPVPFFPLGGFSTTILLLPPSVSSEQGMAMAGVVMEPFAKISWCSPWRASGNVWRPGSTTQTV